MLEEQREQVRDDQCGDEAVDRLVQVARRVRIEQQHVEAPAQGGRGAGAAALGLQAMGKDGAHSFTSAMWIG